MKTVELYIADLKSTIHDKRKRAINALIKLKENEAIRPLLNISADRNVEIRYMVAKAFGVYDDKVLIDPLLKLLSDESPKVRYRAAMSLMNYRHERVVEPLVKALSDPDENVRYWSAKALGKMGGEHVLAKLKLCLSSKEWAVRKTASFAIVEIGSPALAPLLEVLKNGGDDARFWALKSLGKIGEQSATPAVMQCLADANPDVRMAAVEALGRISDSRAIGPLVALAEGNDGSMRVHIKESLCMIGDRSIASLIKLLSSPNWGARKLAASILGEIGGRSIELLMAELKTKNDDELFWVIEALGNLKDKVVTLSLVEFLKHGKPEIRLAAVKALGKIRDERALERLFGLLDENDDEIAGELIKAVAGFGKAAVPSLIRNLGSDRWQVRRNSAMCLIEIGESVAPKMLDLLDCKNRDVCHWAAEVIVAFDKCMEDDLIALMDTGNYDQRFYASRILGRIKSEKALQVLMNGLQDEYWSVRKNSAFSLGELRINEALPSLIKALSDEDEDLRAEVCRALAKFGIAQAGKYLVPYIDDEFSSVRIAAIEAVGKLGYRDATPALAQHINDDNIQVRSAAIVSAGLLRAEACSSLVIRQMDMQELRASCIEALGEMGAVSNLKFLMSLLKSEDREERALAARVLSNFDQREVVRALSDSINDDYYLVRKNAALGITLINERLRAAARARNGEEKTEAESLYSLGMTFLNGKKYSEAIVAFQRLLAVDAKNYNALIKLGIAFENKDMVNEAIESFTRAVVTAPNRPEGFIYLGVALGSIRRYEEALANLKRAGECAKNANTLEIVHKLVKKIKIAMYK